VETLVQEVVKEIAVAVAKNLALKLAERVVLLHAEQLVRGLVLIVAVMIVAVDASRDVKIDVWIHVKEGVLEVAIFLVLAIMRIIVVNMVVDSGPMRYTSCIGNCSDNCTFRYYDTCKYTNSRDY
jgi:hypothetical protein